MMDFGELFSKAWKIIWKHKILWLFGVLAGCGAAGTGGGGGGGGGGGTSSIQAGSWNGGPPFLDSSTTIGLEGFFRTITEVPIWVYILIGFLIFVFVFIISVAFFLLGTLGTTGVIKGTGMADAADLDDPPLSFGTVFNGLKPYYWKVLLFNFGLRVAGLLVGIFLVLPIIIIALCTCGLGLLLLIPISWLIGLLVKLTTVAIVEEDLGIFQAIGRAWKVFTANLGNVLLMFIILSVGSLIIGLIIALPLVIVPIPLVANLVISGFRTFAIGLVMTLLLSLVFVPIVIFLGGILQAFVLACWTLTFRRLTGDGMGQPEVLFGEPDSTKDLD
jgi:hypothetical protein